MPFKIESSGPAGACRLIAPEVLTATEFDEVARQVGQSPRVARKVALVAARACAAEQRVDTFWNGRESTNVAKPGDWIVTSLDKTGQPLRDRAGNTNIYVIAEGSFLRLYVRVDGHNEFGDFYESRSTVSVIALEGGFDLFAPWGERQVGNRGYLVLNGSEVYGNNSETFEASYTFS